MIVVVPVEPPEAVSMLQSLVDAGLLSRTERSTLYRAAVADVARAVDSSGGDLLVMYRDDERADRDQRTVYRELLDANGIDPDDVRFERQVGSNPSARIGNAITHLLEREDEGSAGVLFPTAPQVRRTEIDGAAMVLRRNEVAVGPSDGSTVYFAGFSEPIDFEGVFAADQLPTVAARAASAGYSVGFVPTVPRLDTTVGLTATIATIEARRSADRPVPVATAERIDEFGLTVEDGSLRRT